MLEVSLAQGDLLLSLLICAGKSSNWIFESVFFDTFIASSYTWALLWFSNWLNAHLLFEGASVVQLLTNSYLDCLEDLYQRPKVSFDCFLEEAHELYLLRGEGACNLSFDCSYSNLQKDQSIWIWSPCL